VREVAPKATASFSSATLAKLFAYRPAGSLSRDYHLLAGVFYVSRYAVGSGLHRAIHPPHNLEFNRTNEDANYLIMA